MFRSPEEADDEEEENFMQKRIKSFLQTTEEGETEDFEENLPSPQERQSFKKKRLRYEAIYEIPELEDCFYSFLSQEFNSMALDFIREYDKIEEDVPDEDLVKITEYFYEMYIKVKAKKELNLSGKRRNKIIELLEDSNQLKLKNCWILSKKPKELYGEIYDITKAELGTENFPRFIVSSFWRNISEKYENHPTAMEESTIFNMKEESSTPQKINPQHYLVNKSRRVKEGKSKEDLANEYLNIGIDFMKKQEYQDAYDMFTLSIHVNNKMKESYFNRGVLNYNLKNYVDSIKDMTVVLEIDKGNAKAYAVRGMCLKNLDYFDVAIIDLKRSLKITIIFKNYMVLGICYDNLDDIENAMKCYTSYLEYDSETENAMSVYRNRGQLYFQTMRFELALEDFDNALKICNDDEWRQELNKQRGKCKEKLGIFDEINIDEIDFDDLYNSTIEMFEAQNYKEALKVISRIIKHSKQKESDYHYLRGLIYKKLGKNQKAIRDFQIAFELNSTNVDTLNKLIPLLIEEEKLVAADSFYEKLIQLKPTFKNYYNRALFYYNNLLNKSLAINDLTKAVQLKPDFANGYYNRGLIYLKQASYEEAKNDFDRAISINEEPDYFIERALCLYDLGQVVEAIKDIETALTLDLDNKRANELLYHMQKL